MTPLDLPYEVLCEMVVQNLCRTPYAWLSQCVSRLYFCTCFWHCMLQLQCRVCACRGRFQFLFLRIVAVSASAPLPVWPLDRHTTACELYTSVLPEASPAPAWTGLAACACWVSKAPATAAGGEVCRVGRPTAPPAFGARACSQVLCLRTCLSQCGVQVGYES